MRYVTGSLLSRRHFATLALAACAAFSLLLTGCGVGTPAAAGSGFGAEAIGGSALGGFGPIGNADVYLYVAGTTGYGLGATQLDHTKTSTDGKSSFSFNPTDYTCPAGGQIYLMLKGGDPNGGSAASNTAISLVASIGTCGSLSSYTVINEASTIATVTAAQQFFNAATESFGSPASTQAQTGLANAFALARTIVPPVSGQPIASFTPTSSVSGVTMSATPETSKLNGMADILAACVDTTVNTSPACTDLFNSAVAPPEASATSGSTATYTAASDTLMAAYYMAVNPISGTMTSVGSSPNVTGTNPSCAAAGNTSVSNMTCLFDLITAQPPFATSLAGPSGTPALLDWTLSVAYTATGTCGSIHGAPLTSVQKGAIDANGNVWMITDSILGPGAPTTSTYSVMGELSPTGNLLNCQGGTTDTVAFGRGITIDTAGNIWANSFGGTLVNGSGSSTSYANRFLEYNVNLATPALISETIASGGKMDYIQADGRGNIYAAGNNSSTGNALYGIVGGANLSTSTAVSVATLVAAPLITGDTGTQSLQYMAADSNGNIWVPNHTDTNVAVITPSFVDTTFSVDNVTSQYGAAIDASGYLVLANTCCVAANANKIYKLKPGAAATPGTGTTDGVISAQYAGGISSTRALTIDGANNTWAVGANAVNSSGQLSIAELDGGLNGLSTTGTLTGTGCPATSCMTNGGFAKASLASASDIEVDGSGNVWAFAAAGTQVTQLIGAAAPVVTPMSIATEYSLLGQKPTNKGAVNFWFPPETETAGAGYSATVKFGTNSPAPTGTITFTPVGAGTPTCTLSSGTTPFTGTVACSSANSTLAAGTYNVTVTYSGDSNYYATPSGIVTTLTVQ